MRIPGKGVLNIYYISGFNSFGYNYAIKLETRIENPNCEGDYTYKRSENLEEGVTVWTQDLNRVGKPGSFSCMFKPGATERCLAKI